MTGRAMPLWRRETPAPAASMFEIRVGDEALARFGRSLDEAIASARAVARTTTKPVTVSPITQPDRVLWTSEGGAR